MSNVSRKDIDALNAVLTVSIPKETYLGKVKKEIQKYSLKTTMKGFRPGKTPPQLVRKIYGREFLSDVVNDTIQNELNNYIQAEKLELLGQPLLSIEQTNFQLDLNNPQDVTFKFDIGLAPQFDVKGLDGASYVRYDIKIEDQTINDELKSISKRLGKEEEVENNIQEGDLLTLDIKEIGGTLEKEVMLSFDWMTDDMKSVFMTQSKGSDLQINIFQLEKDTTFEYVRKYFLGLDENDDRSVNENFNATIKAIKRRVDAELTEEVLSKSFGTEIKTIDEAREAIRKGVAANLEAQADSILLRDIQDRLLLENNVALPNSFLVRWLKAQNDIKDDALLTREYPYFADNLRWNLIRSKIVKNNDIEVKEEDLREHYANKIRGYFGGMPIDEGLVQDLVNRVYDNKKQWDELYEEVLLERIFSTIKTQITVVEKPISNVEFQEVVKQAQVDAIKKREPVQEEVAELTQATETAE
jgi:trigger factor